MGHSLSVSELGHIDAAPSHEQVGIASTKKAGPRTVVASQYYHWQDCRYETGIRVEALAADQAPEMAASRSELWASVTVWPSGSEALAVIWH